MTNKKVSFILLFILIIVFIIFSLLTIQWGLQNENHLYSYNGDEDTNISMFRNINFKKLDFNPKYYVSGTFGYYLLAGSVYAGKILNLYNLETSTEYYRINFNELRRIYLIQRCLIIILSTLLIIVSYLIGKELIGNKFGLLLALIIAFLPTILVNSQYCTHNIILIFLLSLSYYFMIKFLKTNKLKWLILLSIFSGLSFSTKHSGIFSLIFIFYSIFTIFKENSYKKCIKYLVLCHIMFFITFFITSPYWVINTFIALINFPNLENVSGIPQGFFWNFGLFHIFTYSFSVFKIYFFEIGLILLFSFYLFYNWKKLKCRKFLIPLIIFILIFHVSILFTSYGTDSRLLPNAFFLTILSSIGFYKFLKNKYLKYYIKYTIVFIVFLWIFSYSINIKYRFLKSDNREISSQWIENNILNQDNVTIGLHEEPWYAHPDIITKEWMHNKHPESEFYSNIYNEVFFIPEFEKREYSSEFFIVPDNKLITIDEKIIWLINNKPDYIILMHEIEELIPYFNESADYELVKYFPKYNILGLNNLAIKSFGCYIYKRKNVE